MFPEENGSTRCSRGYLGGPTFPFSRAYTLELGDANPRVVDTARTAVFLTVHQAYSMTPDVAVLTLHHVVVPPQGFATEVTTF
jgi:hypothetical protein